MNHFKHTFGITKDNSKSIETITLHFTDKQSRYFLSKPFHEFKRISQDENGLTVEMQLIPNYELLQKLASLGEGVKVLSPKIVQDNLKKHLMKALNRYNKFAWE